MNIYNTRVYKGIKRIWYKFYLARYKKKGVPCKVNDFEFRMPVSSYEYFGGRYFPDEYERENFAFFKSKVKDGMDCIDIGAHIGLYAVYMSSQANVKVYSFEPTPSSQKVFRDMVSVNGKEAQVTLVPGAVSDKPGKATFYMKETPLWVGNSLRTRNFADNKIKGYEVDVYSIDNFVQSKNLNPGFIKIDAEGVELEVLQGAKETFKLFKPSGILGIHPSTFEDKKATYQQLWDTLSGYGVQILFDNKPLSEEVFMTKLLAEKNPFDLQFVGQ